MDPTPSPCGTSPATPRTTSSSSAAQGEAGLGPLPKEKFSPREVVMGRFQGGPRPTEAFTPPKLSVVHFPSNLSDDQEVVI